MEIPVKTALRIIKHVKRTDRPLLEYRLDQYHTTLIAVESYSQFLVADWSPPFETLREYWVDRDGDVFDSLEQMYGIDPESLPEDYNGDEQQFANFMATKGIDVDRKILTWDSRKLEYTDATYSYELLDPYDTPTAAAHSVLTDAGVELVYTCSELDDYLGEIELSEGPYPGNDYVGATWTCLEALSCLQVALDAVASGVKITFKATRKSRAR
jgi:hypothetical protein